VTTIFDSDHYDAEIIVERTGRAQFYVADVAQVLGLATQSVWVYVRRGKIPAPDRYEEDWAPGRKAGTYRAVWTPQQVVDALAHR